MTVVFEFGFGHFVAKQSWSKTPVGLRPTEGPMWPLVLVAIGTAPALARVTPRRDIRRWGATDDGVPANCRVTTRHRTPETSRPTR